LFLSASYQLQSTSLLEPPNETERDSKRNFFRREAGVLCVMLNGSTASRSGVERLRNAILYEKPYSQTKQKVRTGAYMLSGVGEEVSQG
jgi:hypothetical protein